MSGTRVADEREVKGGGWNRGAGNDKVIRKFFPCISILLGENPRKKTSGKQEGVEKECCVKIEGRHRSVQQTRDPESPSASHGKASKGRGRVRWESVPERGVSLKGPAEKEDCFGSDRSAEGGGLTGRGGGSDTRIDVSARGGTRGGWLPLEAPGKMFLRAKRKKRGLVVCRDREFPNRAANLFIRTKKEWPGCDRKNDGLSVSAGWVYL